MLINVIVNPHSRFEKIEKLADKNYRVFFNVIPEKGRANLRLINLLAEYFDVPKASVKVRLGKTAKEKVVEISDI